MVVFDFSILHLLSIGRNHSMALDLTLQVWFLLPKFLVHYKIFVQRFGQIQNFVQNRIFSEESGWTNQIKPTEA